ncbi:UNVERIFIED_CONTAM: hypothetical protein FKN15_071003 [Acipenser sinensis]
MVAGAIMAGVSSYRWCIVIHGGIDGFSRLIVYLKDATNTRAPTVLEHFIAAVDQYGLPSQIQKHFNFFKEGRNNRKLRINHNWTGYNPEWATEDPTQVMTT